MINPRIIEIDPNQTLGFLNSIDENKVNLRSNNDEIKFSKFLHIFSRSKLFESVLEEE